MPDWPLLTVPISSVFRVQIFDEIADCVEPFEFPVVSQNHREDETHLQPVQGMTERQHMDHSKKDSQKNDKANFVLRSMEHLQLQADSCIAMAKKVQKCTTMTSG